MKRSIVKLICLLSTICISANGQGLHNYSFKLEGLYGSVMKHNDHLINLAKGNVIGAALCFEWQTDGSAAWHQYFNFPSVGVSGTFMDLGNSEMLGKLFSVYPYLQLPIVRSEGLQLNVKPGAGVAFITKYYGNTSHIDDRLDVAIVDENGNTSIIKNGANGAIGSMLNVFLALGVNAEYAFSEDFSASLGVAWNHASNGSIIQPNSGINMINAYIGFAYIPNSEMIRVVQRGLLDNVPRRVSVEAVLSGGMRQLYYKDGKNYPTASFNVAAYYPLTNSYRMGLGVDAFFDGVYAYQNVPQASGIYQRTYIDNDKFANKLRAGVSWRHELVFGNFTAGFHFGVYLYDPIKNLEPYNKVVSNSGEPLKKGVFYKYDINIEDGWLYSRAVGKYYFSDHFFASIGLKTHLQRAEFIEWGLGYRF
ncbi:MAG: acyloxyacyl hydrolase [Prevotellaceae bacterium]|jgi:hypothetical protein|nr:acyloxyacyl hydrolase [Prevotellaceae bacterium]